MTIAIYLITILTNSFYAIKKEKSKVLLLMSFILIVFLMGGAGPSYVSANHSGDYGRYVDLYKKSLTMGLFEDLQIGYISLMKLGHIFKLDFMVLRLIVIAICYLLLYHFVIKKYSVNPHFIIIMYLIMPMIIDSEQFRNFIAMTILLIGITQLQKDTLKSKGIFLLFVILSASFHTVFLVYGLLIFATTKEKNTPALLIAGLALLVSAVAVLNGNEIPFLNSIVSPLFGDQRIVRYLTAKTNLGYIVPILLQGMSIVLLFWSKKILQRTTTKNIEFEPGLTTEQPDFKLFGTLIQKDPELIVKFTNLIFWVNILGVAFSLYLSFMFSFTV